VDLLNGFLSEKERDRVFAHIRTCGACEALLQERVTDRERLRALHPVPTMEGAGASQPSGLERFLRMLLSPIQLLTQKPAAGLAVATAAVALIVVLVVLPDRGEQQQGPFWLPADGTSLQLRDTGGGRDLDKLAAGLSAYGERDLAQSIELLSSIELAGSDELMRRIYLASALTHTGDHERALALLETVRANLLPEPWRSETRWTIYVCLSELNRMEEARALLNELKTEEGEIGDRARGLSP